MAYEIKDVSGDIRGGRSVLATVETIEAARTFLADSFVNHSVAFFDIDEDHDAADALLIPANTKVGFTVQIAIEAAA
ncbi:hypothetical protein [Ensifer sp. LCM 4579]|uniref:hypothetical protein n=1 Tax=Ensifer sp. LCM 4579 TaxID=1848292 RepID=UPI0008D9FBD5|nr:hypothetical protein [Ensifer sp. LCM 4579]OHV73361.1 hypothetical protein LCM4579_10595 [Ensifer sp. LCM 4579]